MKTCRKQNRDLLKTLCNTNRILRPRTLRKHNLSNECDHSEETDCIQKEQKPTTTAAQRTLKESKQKDNDRDHVFFQRSTVTIQACCAPTRTETLDLLERQNKTASKK